MVLPTGTHEDMEEKKCFQIDIRLKARLIKSPHRGQPASKSSKTLRRRRDYVLCTFIKLMVVEFHFWKKNTEEEVEIHQ